MATAPPAPARCPLAPEPELFAAPLLVFAVLLAIAAAVNLLAGPDTAYWALAAPLGLLAVVALAVRDRRRSSPWLLVAWALVPVVATRVAAVLSGDIAVADVVLGLVVAGQALVLRSAPLVAGGLACALLSAALGLLLTGEVAREVAISGTSGASLALAALAVRRGGAGFWRRRGGGSSRRAADGLRATGAQEAA